MSVQHFKSLLFKSAKIQQEIEKEQKRRWPDWMRLLKLKKLRLAIKDRMERIVQNGVRGHLGGGHLKEARVPLRRARNKYWHSV